MVDGGVVSFWSYAHDDNRSSGGGILRLATDIAQEYDLLTAQELRIFIDHSSIDWGDNWKDRIDTSLSATTFFIPIITPRYFKRDECRRELVEFSTEAKSLGLEDFILPILYATIPSFSSDNPDQLVALVARTQYVDWRELRLLEPSSSEYRKAVHSLATRLIEIESRLASIQVKNETPTSAEDGEEGLLELVDEIVDRLPDWIEAVSDSETTGAQMDATAKLYTERLHRLQAQRPPQSAITATLQRFCKEMQPLADRSLGEARVYSARSIELDPLITTAIRLASEHRVYLGLIEPIRDAIADAIRNIEEDEEEGKQSLDKLRDSELLRQYVGLSRTLKELIRVMTETNKLVDEGNRITKAWNARLSQLHNSGN